MPFAGWTRIPRSSRSWWGAGKQPRVVHVNNHGIFQGIISLIPNYSLDYIILWSLSCCCITCGRLMVVLLHINNKVQLTKWFIPLVRIKTSILSMYLFLQITCWINMYFRVLKDQKEIWVNLECLEKREELDFLACQWVKKNNNNNNFG